MVFFSKMHAFELLNLFIAFYLNNQTIAGAARYESPRSRVKAADVTVPINSLVHVILYKGLLSFPCKTRRITVPHCFCVAPSQQLRVYYNSLKAETQGCMVTPSHHPYMQRNLRLAIPCYLRIDTSSDL